MDRQRAAHVLKVSYFRLDPSRAPGLPIVENPVRHFHKHYPINPQGMDRRSQTAFILIFLRLIISKGFV